jgi:hypothetical protein
MVAGLSIKRKVEFPDFFLRRSRSDPFPVLSGTKFTDQNRNQFDNQILMSIDGRKLRKLYKGNTVNDYWQDD